LKQEYHHNDNGNNNDFFVSDRIVININIKEKIKDNNHNKDDKELEEIHNTNNIL